ncbi:unnamed protein product [Rhizoctonia solani]|uniref:Uncharacterized protein n=1 Tax=Rhizoctonia solani TaxID=456999 RepID=A0A8H2XX45_9AGAM|nr:unnamed protein product [Rhizoctonia solani]
MDTNNTGVQSIYRTFHGPWHGDSKIALGIDVGTTYSGVAFTYLCRGQEQMLHRVDRWPGQEGQNFSGKIPSVVCYINVAPYFQAVSFGAEALTSEIQEEAEENDWQLAQHFKLHLHPPTLLAKHKITLDALPPGVSVKQIYSDFLRYLLLHTRERFEEVISDGKTIWESYSNDMDVIIAHPNGWGIREQAFMRNAAVLAGFTTTEKANQQIRFVTEAEASVHFCMHYTSLRSCLETGINFIVCDAGGSTVDTTFYTVSSARPKLQLDEKGASACVQSGAIFIDHQAELYLREHFERCNLSLEKVDEYVTAGIQDFKYREKLRFGGANTELRLKVAVSRLRDDDIGIRSGSIVKTRIFDPCVDDIVNSVSSQIGTSSVSYLLIVGGFGNNPYLIQRLKASFESSGCNIIVPNEATSKAVADGAIIWHCVNSVVKRAPRLAYGIETYTEFDPQNPDHQLRDKIPTPDNKTGVTGVWSQIVPKGTPVDCDSFIRQSYVRLFTTASPDLENLQDEIFACSREGIPSWVKTPSDELESGFHSVCTIVSDFSRMRGVLRRQRGRHHPYWTLSFNICIRFGRTELEAFIEWTENGEPRTGPVKIVPIPELELA